MIIVVSYKCLLFGSVYAQLLLSKTGLSCYLLRNELDGTSFDALIKPRMLKGSPLVYRQLSKL